MLQHSFKKCLLRKMEVKMYVLVHTDSVISEYMSCRKQIKNSTWTQVSTNEDDDSYEENDEERAFIVIMNFEPKLH